jgi:preprotein translocase subunit SecD
VTNTVLLSIFAVAGVALAAWGYLRRGRRVACWIGALLAFGAAGAARVDAFWPMLVLGVLALWAFLAAVDYIDLAWRMRAGLVMAVSVVALFCFWPTLERLSGGRLPCPSYVKDRVGFRLVAGLDLRGGLRLVYTVDVEEAIKDKRDGYYEDMRVELAKIYGLFSEEESKSRRPSEEVYGKLRELVNLEAPRSQPNVIKIEVKPGADPTKIDARFRELFSGDLTPSISADGRSMTYRVREASESAIRERAVDQAREIILRRVDELGLREASVSTRDEDIIIEVPGEDEKSFATIREIISQTARLEFKLLDDDTDYFEPIRRKANKDNTPEGLEFLRETAPVGLDDQGEIKYNQIVYAFLKKKPEETSKQTLDRMREWVATLELPPDREIGFELEYEPDPDTLKETEKGWRTYLLKSRAEITGDLVRDAAAVPNQDQGSLGGWYVSLTFTDRGGQIFGQITGANVRRRFAIILDRRVESAPVILGPIPGGHAQITLGSNDPEIQLRDARKLELVLRSGALPAPISPSNEQRIGPSLGQDSIKLGVEGALGGSLLVMLFMLFYYRRAGLISDLTVMMNLFLQLAVLCSFGASMTLPGIAGLALTVGMGIDNAVLINERIRDELRAGKTPRAAVEVGFNRALSAIMDGQVTIIIAGVVMAQYGTGPIKGFAITLIVGVICGTFTGVIVNRLLFDLWVRGFGRLTRLDVG